MSKRGIKMGGPSKGRTVGRKRKEPDTSTYQGRLAARLRMLREKAGKTVPEFSDALGILAKTYYGYETGDRDWPNELTPKAAKALGIQARTLYPEQ